MESRYLGYWVYYSTTWKNNYFQQAYIKELTLAQLVEWTVAGEQINP